MGFFDFVKQGLGITNAQKALQTVGQYAPEASRVIQQSPAQYAVKKFNIPSFTQGPSQFDQPQLQLPRFEMPKYLPSTVQWFGNTLGNLPSMIAESTFNAPAKLSSGIFNTADNLLRDFKYGEDVPITDYAKGVAQFGEGAIDLATMDLAKNVAKAGIKSALAPPVKKTVSSMLKSTANSALKLSGQGAMIGGVYGVTGGLQQPNDGDVGTMLNNAYNSAVEGVKGGAVAGPVIGGAIHGVSKMLTGGNKMLKAMTKKEKQAGYVRINGQVDKTPPPKEGYKRYEITVQGKKVYADVNPQRNGGHIEFQSEKGNPISETGYKSHFAPIPENVTVNDLQVLGERLASENKPIKKVVKPPVAAEPVKPVGNLEIPSMDKFLARTKKTLEPKQYAPEKVATLYKPTGNVQLNVRETQLADTLVKEMSLQGPKTFDNTKAHAYVEGVIKSLGANKVEQIRTETLKFNKERGISKFHELVQQEIQNNEAIAKAAETKSVSEMLKRSEPIISPKPSIVTTETKVNTQDNYGSPKDSKPPSPPKYPTRKGNKYLSDAELIKEEAATRQHLEDWAGKTRQAESKGTEQGYKFKNVPEKIKTEVIEAREKTATNPSAEAKDIGGKLGEVFDTLHEVAKKHGMELAFKEDFYTHIWDKESIDQMIRDRVMGRSVSGDPYFLKGQKITYKEGLERGYKPELKTVAQDVEYYAQRLYKSIANRDLVATLKKDGIAFDYQAGSQYKPVSILGYVNELDGSNVAYLTKNSANLVSKVFNPKQAEAVWEKGLEKTAKFGKGATQVILSGGYRNINAMGIGKLLFKELPSGNFKAVKRFVQALIPSQEGKIYQDIAKDVMKYQGWGIDLHVGKQSVVDTISNKNISRTIPEKIVKVFKDNMESPTFDFFVPATQVDFARSIEKQARSKGLSEGAVRDVVKKAMSNKYDVGSSLNSMLQNRNLQNLLDTIFFAKTLRKTTIKTNIINNIKALKNPLALENQGNIAGMVGGVIGLSILNAVNKASTGKNMWENPDGWNYAYIKYGENEKGEDKYFRLNTTTIEYTWLKQLLGMAQGAIKGDGKQVSQNAKQILQFGLKTVVDLVTNTDWKMDKIYESTDSMTDKLKKLGTNTLNQNLHPVAKGLMTFFEHPDDEQRWQKLIGDATEIPGSFKTEKQYKTSTYYKTERDVLEGLSDADKELYASIKEKGVDFDSKQRDKVADAYALLNNPKVLSAMRDVAVTSAQRNNEPYDPLWNLSDSELKKYYQIQGLTNNGDEQKAMKEKEKSWWQPLKVARGEFFDELLTTGVMEKEDSEYPEPSTDTQKLLDTYYSFAKGTGERTRFAKAHPELVDYWNKVAEYYDKVANAFGIPPKPPYGSGSKSKWKNYAAMNLAKKIKAANTKSVKNMFKKSKIKTPKYKSMKMKIIKPKKRKSIKAILVKPPNYKSM